VELKAEEFELERDSVILLEQIRTIDKKRLKSRIGHLEGDIMDKVNQGLAISLGLVEV